MKHITIIHQSGGDVITAKVLDSIEEALLWVWSEMGGYATIQIPPLNAILPFMQATGRFTNSITADSSFKITIIQQD